MTSSTRKILATLCWSPIYKSLEYTIRDDNQLIFAVVPFVKLNALKELHRITLGHLPAKIICRWLAADIIAGVSDLDIFPYLATQGCELYINPEIHLKLYVFNSNTALNTSGNLTMRGLGFSENANIEVGSMVSLEAIDTRSSTQATGSMRHCIPLTEIFLQHNSQRKYPFCQSVYYHQESDIRLVRCRPSRLRNN